MGSTVFGNTKTDEKKDKDSAKKDLQKYGNYVFMIADYFDFTTNITENKKDFAGYTMSVKNSDGKNARCLPHRLFICSRKNDLRKNRQRRQKI